ASAPPTPAYGHQLFAQKKASGPAVGSLTYSELLHAIDADKVTAARISSDAGLTRIEVTLRDGTTRTSWYLPSDTLVQQHLVAHGARVTVAGRASASWLTIVPSLVLVLVILPAVFFLLLRRGRGLPMAGRGPAPAAQQTYASSVVFAN